MQIIGCDFHPSFQQIAMLDTETGQYQEKRLLAAEAAEFYGQLPGRAWVGMEACGNTLWFERLLRECGHELWLGVGPITALAYALTLGQIERFAHSRQVVSYLGLNPSEHSSGGRQRLGAISKQGNPMVRSLFVEAGQSAARLVPELKRAYQRLKHRKHSSVAKVMVARKLAVRLYWMWKLQQPYTAPRMQGNPSHPVAER